jgi:two-component system response regulator PilR (NtrC family)
MHLASRFVGRSAEAVLVRQLIAIAAKTETPVLILGDTGTGKEVVAREIHRNGARKNRKFITVNCGAIPRELFESELFGHMPGAFTGAERRKQGLWESAENGTLFLDEIGDLSPDHQVKILRALEERRIRPVGASEDITAAPRVIAATNRDLFSMVRRGGFREDLYYRLRGFFIHTPALRDHPADIPLIAAYLWERIAPDAPPLTGEVLESMAGYPWPGNARELKMVLLHMYTLFGGVQATVEHLRAVFQIEGKTTTSAEPVDGEREIILHRAECLRHLKRVHEVIHAARYVLAQVSNATKPDENALESVHGAVIRRLRELEQLCRHPLRFHSEKTFSAVRRLTENTAFISGLVNAGANGAERRFSAEIHGAFDAAMTAVFHEIESLMAEGKP